MHTCVQDAVDLSQSAQPAYRKPDQPEIPVQPRQEVLPAEPIHWNPEWNEHVKDLIQKELENAEGDLFRKVERVENRLKGKTISGYLNPDVPPAPPRLKRKMKGSKGHISARVDLHLLDLFRKDRDKAFEGNSSRCLEWILWHFYGKPLLSFETGEDKEQGNQNTLQNSDGSCKDLMDLKDPRKLGESEDLSISLRPLNIT
jgi:hypothetical protein